MPKPPDDNPPPDDDNPPTDGDDDAGDDSGDDDALEKLAGVLGAVVDDKLAAFEKRLLKQAGRGGDQPRTDFFTRIGLKG
jgi:hypothetical protein